jgi:hypothetical protein
MPQIDVSGIFLSAKCCISSGWLHHQLEINSIDIYMEVLPPDPSPHRPAELLESKKERGGSWTRRSTLKVFLEETRRIKSLHVYLEMLRQVT